MTATGFLTHELYLWHDTGTWPMNFRPGLHIQPGTPAENPETKRRFRNLLEVSGLLDSLTPIKPVPATDDQIAAFHTRDYIARIKELSAGNGGEAAPGTPFGHGGYEIAALAAGGSMAMTDAVLTGKVRHGYALVRPPGHHAEPAMGYGFCLFGNIVLAIHHARAMHKVGRVAVVDWDVHHGNGTEAGFYGDRDTLTISIHQDNLYPAGRGRLADQGEGAGRGANLNIPLPPGCGDGAYRAVMEQVVVPALTRFRPELMIIASGFDASGLDPLGRMMVTSSGFRQMTGTLMAAADALCGGRLVLSHEGGYSEFHVPYCGLAVMEALAGRSTGIVDPFGAEMEQWGGQALQPHQASWIAQAAALVPGVPG
jgi:acetoin utilization deacetylase AcuC-like enzyme